jgi:transcriptional repressor NF-X1
LTCDKSCEKLLSCGPADNRHQCSKQCHHGPCPTCDKQSTLQCRCGRLQKSISCTDAIQFDAFKNPFRCESRCTKKKLCGKHRYVCSMTIDCHSFVFDTRCNEMCCNRDVHICERVCGKLLNCNLQYVAISNRTHCIIVDICLVSSCDDLCHKSYCRQCPIVNYDELTCRCGQTVMQPPIACGTLPPTCNYKCDRTHACDHPVYHSCHNEQECPPCAHLVSKMCVGEHTMRDNVRI